MRNVQENIGVQPAQKGRDVKPIMRLGGWEKLDIVGRYKRSVRFEDSLKMLKRERWNELRIYDYTIRLCCF